MNDKETTLTFTGDISFSKYFSSVQDEALLLSDEISCFLSSSDYCLGNIEGPITVGNTNAEDHFKHYSDPKCIKFLYDHNIHVWNLANNHMLDFGALGVTDTLKIANDYGISCIGVGTSECEAKAYVINESGGIAVISLTYDKRSDSGTHCMRYDEFTEIQRVITELKSKNRWCIVVVHAGDEFTDIPLPETRKIYQKYLTLGADIVVGHHPHVVQNYEIVEEGNKVIFYSLGNFIFDTDYQRAQSHTDVGILLKLHFSKKSYRWESNTIKISRESQRISEAPTPVIFTDIKDQQYKRLWKMAARELVHHDRTAIAFVYPERFKKYNLLLWLIREMKIFVTQKEKRQRILGKILSYITVYTEQDKVYLRYMKE